MPDQKKIYMWRAEKTHMKHQREKQKKKMDKKFSEDDN